MQFEDINRVDGIKALKDYMTTTGISEYEGELNFKNGLEGRIVITGGYVYVYIECGNAKELVINCNDENTKILIGSDTTLDKIVLNYGVTDTQLGIYKYSLTGKSIIKQLELRNMEQLYNIEAGAIGTIKCRFIHGMELLYSLDVKKNQYLINALEGLHTKRFILEYSIETLSGVIVKNYGNQEKWGAFCKKFIDPNKVVFIEVIKGIVTFYTDTGAKLVVRYDDLEEDKLEALERLIREEMLTLACHVCCSNKTLKQVKA